MTLDFLCLRLDTQQPIAGVRVDVFHDGSLWERSGYTGTDGKIAFADAPIGRHNVSFTHPDYADETASFTAPGGYIIQLQWVEPEVRTYDKTFIVESVDGKPLEAVAITAEWFSVHTDAAGHASVPYRDERVGRHTVSFELANHAKNSLTIDFPRENSYNIVKLIRIAAEKGVALTDMERLAFAIISAYITYQGVKALQGLSPASLIPG